MVNLEEGHVVSVGDLADQGVVEDGVGGRGVVPVHGKNAGKSCTWNQTKTLTLAAVGLYLDPALDPSNVPAGVFSLTQAV